MPLLPGFKDELIVNGRTFLDYVPSTEQAIRDAAVESFVRSPLSSLKRIEELGVARTGYPSELLLAYMEGAEFLFEKVPTGRTIPPEEANALGKPFGLTFERSVTERELEVLIKRKKKEISRNLTLSRTRGFGQKSAVLATELLSTLADPLNIASAFIPVVSQARFAQFAQRFGTGIARVGKGGVEGLVGALAAESIVLSASNQEQADYGLQESMLNLVFGTVLGGGLHAGVGKLGDVLRRRRIKLADDIEARAIDDVNIELEMRLRERVGPEIWDDMSVDERASAIRGMAGQANEDVNINGKDFILDPERTLESQAQDVRNSIDDITNVDSYNADYPILKDRVESSTHDASVEVAEEITDQIESELREQADDIVDTITRFDDEIPLDEIAGESQTLRRTLGVDSTGRFTEIDAVTQQTDDLNKVMDNPKIFRNLLGCILGAL